MNWNARFQTNARYLSLGVLGIGCLVLVGWLVDSIALKSLMPGLAAMKPNTAISFALAGLALYLLHPDKPSRRGYYLGQLAAAGVIVIGLLILSQYMFGWNLGIDQLVFPDLTTPTNVYPGRTSPLTALCILFSGVALLLMALPRWRISYRLLAGLVCGTGVFAMIAYLYRLSSLYHPDAFTALSLNSAAAFTLLGFGMLFARPDQGFFHMLADEGAAGIFMRRLIPACFLIPIFTGWLILVGHNSGYYDLSVSLALFAILTIFVFSILTWTSARLVFHKDRAYKHSQQRFKTLFDESLDVILVVDGENSRIIHVNNSVTRSLGYAPEELVGERFATLFPPQTEADQLRFTINLQAYGSVFMSHDFRRKDDTVCPMDVTAAMIPWEKDRAILITLRDVSERQQLVDEIFRAERLHEEIERERELTRLKEDFITMVSHDFRTPLAVIMTSGDMLERYYERLTEQRRIEQLQKIRQQVWYMTDLLDDVLLLGKARAKRLEFNPAPIDLKKVCWTVFDEARVTDGDKHIFQFNANGQFNDLRLDEKLVHRVLANLLTNAVKYSPQGGTVRLELSREGDEVLLSVSDEGIGIPEKDQQRLFEPFHRGTNTNGIIGTGLGLAIVYESLQIHGGAIAVASEEGQGTTFTVRLPVR